jgi:hypothetical protein
MPLLFALRISSSNTVIFQAFIPSAMFSEFDIFHEFI